MMGLFQNIYEGYQQEVLKEEAIIVAYQGMVEKIKKNEARRLIYHLFLSISQK